MFDERLSVFPRSLEAAPVRLRDAARLAIGRALDAALALLAFRLAPVEPGAIAAIALMALGAREALLGPSAVSR